MKLFFLASSIVSLLFVTKHMWVDNLSGADQRSQLEWIGWLISLGFYSILCELQKKKDTI